ncbi:hypothetical protein IAR50_002544 [Cryptococcus sp. DSM 104548]
MHLDTDDPHLPQPPTSSTPIAPTTSIPAPSGVNLANAPVTTQEYPDEGPGVSKLKKFKLDPMSLLLPHERPSKPSSAGAAPAARPEASYGSSSQAPGGGMTGVQRSGDGREKSSRYGESQAGKWFLWLM